jgi:peroxiredoxin
MILEVMIENDRGATPSVKELGTWADRYGLTMPVLADEDLLIWSYAADMGGSVGLPFTVIMKEGVIIGSIANGSQLNKAIRQL